MTEQFGGYKLDFAGRTETMEQVFGTGNLSPGAMTKTLWDFVKSQGLERKVSGR